MAYNQPMPRVHGLGLDEACLYWADQHSGFIKEVAYRNTRCAMGPITWRVTCFYIKGLYKSFDQVINGSIYAHQNSYM